MNDSTAKLLEAYRSAHEPPAEEVARSLESVEARIAAGDPGLTLLPDTASAITPAVKLVLLGGLLTLLGVGVGFGLGVWRGPRVASAVPEIHLPRAEAGVQGEDRVAEAPLDPRAVGHAHSRSTPSEREPAEPDPAETVESVKPAVADAPSRPTGKRPKGAPKPVAAATPGPSTLAEEMKLLGRGRAALRDGDWATAASVFDEHARRFADGELAEEREVNRHELLCARGETDAANALRTRFRSRFPGSPHRAKLRKGCGGAP